MANNSFIYDGALAGATGGVHYRWLTNTDSGSYVAIRNLLVAFANAVDALIPASPTVNPADCALIQSICDSVLAERYLTPETNIQPLVQAVVALYNSIKTQTIPIPYYPSIDGLTAVKYVDKNTTIPVTDQNGSALRPYSTIARAITALTTGGTILVVPGDYTTEGPLAFGASNWCLSALDVHPSYVFGALGPRSVSVAALSGTGTINLIGINATSTLTFNGINADSCTFAGALSCVFIDGFDCRFFNGATIAITVGMGLTDCMLDVGVITSAVPIICRLIDCELSGSFTFTSGATGTFVLCGRTNFFLQSITNTITNANVTVQSTPGQNVFQPSPIAANGALGLVDITTMQSGGVLLLQPTGNYNIDAFTAKTNGFWFDIFVDSTNLNFVGQLNQEVGASSTTRIRNPYNLPYQMVAGQVTRMRYQFNRWRVGSPPTSACQALLTVPTPALVAATTGYVNVSLVGTALAGTPANAQVYASPQADLAAAGAGAGYYINCRMTATDSLRMQFVGAIAGGNVNFLATRF